MLIKEKEFILDGKGEHFKIKKGNSGHEFKTEQCLKSNFLFNSENSQGNNKHAILEDKLTNSTNYSYKKSPNISLCFSKENMASKASLNSGLKKEESKNEIYLKVNLIDAKNEANLPKASKVSNSTQESTKKSDTNKTKTETEMKLNKTRNYDVFTLE